MNRGIDEPHEKVVIDPAELEASGPATARTPAGHTDEPRPQFARGTREQVAARPPVTAGVAIPRPRDPAAVPIPRPRDLERRPVLMPVLRPHDLECEARNAERPPVTTTAPTAQPHELEHSPTAHAPVTTAAPTAQSHELEHGPIAHAPVTTAAPIARLRELERSPVAHPPVTTAPAASPRDPIAVLRAYPHTSGSNAEPPPLPRNVPPVSRRRVQDKIVLAHLALDLYQEIDQLQAIVQRAHDASPSADAGTCS